MTDTVIFDMDGLMIDSENWTFEEYVKVCAEKGYIMDRACYKSIVGYTMTVIRQKFREHFGADFPLEEIISQVHENLDRRFAQEGIPVKPGLMALLDYLKQRRCRMVVATSSDRKRVDAILRRGGLEEYFVDVVCGDEVKNGKPDPEIFLKACEKAGASPETALVLEDSEWGILAAHRAGIPCICIPDMKEPGDESKALTVAVMSSLEEVIGYLQKSVYP
jgi:HAD superfamily hydrolase (TIGR01509 family)